MSKTEQTSDNHKQGNSSLGGVGKSLLEEYPNFEKAYSARKLHKDLQNPICKCKGGYCYARNDKGDIIRACEL